MPTKVIVFLIVLFALGWNRLDAKIRFGPVVGFGTVLGNTPVEDYGSLLDGFTLKTNLYIGVDLDFRIAGMFTISPSLLYKSISAKYSIWNYYPNGGNYSNYNQIPKGSFRANYLELPILFKVKLKKGMNFSAGPYLEHLVSTNIPISVDRRDPYKDYDIGLKFGGGYDLKNGFGINANVSFDFSHYDWDLWTGESGSMYTWIAVGAHYLFGNK